MKTKNTMDSGLVTEEKDHKFTFAIAIIIIFAGIAAYQTLKVTQLKQSIYDREIKQIHSDKQSLEIVRMSQFERSVIKLELFKVGGIKTKQIDSLRNRLFKANAELILRDSLFIQSRRLEAEKLKP